MRTFKDELGRDWDLTLDAPKIFRIRSESCGNEKCAHEQGHCKGVDLAGADGQSYERLAADPCLLVDILWVLCAKQAEAKQVDQSSFAEGLVGDALDRATEAMLAGIADFFPSSKRTLVKAVAAKNSAIREHGMKRVLAKINDPEMEGRVLAALEDRLNRDVQEALTQLSGATNTRASSESPPTESPTEN